MKRCEDDLVYVEDDLGSDDARRRRDGVSSSTAEDLLGAMTALLREMKATRVGANDVRGKPYSRGGGGYGEREIYRPSS